MTDPRRVTITVNDTMHNVEVEPRRTLVDVLRHDLGYTGTHVGCEHGVCGACTVLLDDEPVRSCLVFAVECDGSRVVTVEGLGDQDRLSPLQEIFSASHALQCGFCTPGFLMLATAFLRDHPSPTDDDIRETMASNLCRCTGYQNILRAVRAAADTANADREAPGP
jgi:aerobic-type carbon monoxide dehydrogenase small subunit (CoxS/CutS family)